MIEICKSDFGITKNNERTYLFTLKSDDIEAVLSNYGANIVSLKVPDNNRKMIDVVLGYDNLRAYEKQEKYIGALIGRCCNRIKNGTFELNGKSYHLYCNDGNNHLHGGKIGFDKKVWCFDIIENGMKFSYSSPDVEEGYPGNLDVNVIYTLENKSLKINFIAKSDKDTICSLTNHSYFNLDGIDSGEVLLQKIQINADYFTENDEYSIPTGNILPVENTPMDFRIAKQIGKDLENEYYQIKFAKGFDNNWCINHYDGTIKKAAEAYSDKTGIKLEVYTDMPGVQFYSGNYLNGAENGKNGMPIKNRYGFCLECQNYPDAIHNKNFTSPVLKQGEIYNKTIIYNFL